MHLGTLDCSPAPTQHPTPPHPIHPVSLTLPPAGAAAALFQLFTQLPRQLSPPALSVIATLDLDSFPASPEAWGGLKGLPCLRELLLPPFKPALPHTHLPALASLTQLTGLTASVQVGGGARGGVTFRTLQHACLDACTCDAAAASLTTQQKRMPHTQ